MPSLLLDNGRTITDFYEGITISFEEVPVF